MRRLWDRIQNDPAFLRQVNGWATLFWITMIPISVLFLKSSIAYLVMLSVYAVIMGHWSTWAAARVEETQAKEAEERTAHPVEVKVVEQLIAETVIEPAGGSTSP